MQNVIKELMLWFGCACLLGALFCAFIAAGMIADGFGV